MFEREREREREREIDVMAMRGVGKIRSLWSEEEDRILMDYVEAHGEGRWNDIPKRTGLVKRCGKSCRLRWINYLSPKVKRGDFTEEEEDLIIRLHNLLGNRWSLIAGRVPGRTDNQVKNHWNTRLSKKLLLNPPHYYPTPRPHNHFTTTTMKQPQIRPADHQTPPDQKKLDDDSGAAAAMKDVITDPFWDSGDMDLFFFFFNSVTPDPSLLPPSLMELGQLT